MPGCKEARGVPGILRLGDKFTLARFPMSVFWTEEKKGAYRHKRQEVLRFQYVKVGGAYEMVTLAEAVAVGELKKRTLLLQS
jgi:hypothetical protein